MLEQDVCKTHSGCSEGDFTFHGLLTACVGSHSSSLVRNASLEFLTPDSFRSLAAVWIVVPESLPARLTTHLDSLLSVLASLVPVCYPAYPLLAPLLAGISVYPDPGWSAWWEVHGPLLIRGLWACPWLCASDVPLLEPGLLLTPALTLPAWLALGCSSCSSPWSSTPLGLLASKPQGLRLDFGRIFAAWTFTGDRRLPVHGCVLEITPDFIFMTI